MPCEHYCSTAAEKDFHLLIAFVFGTCNKIKFDDIVRHLCVSCSCSVKTSDFIMWFSHFTNFGFFSWHLIHHIVCRLALQQNISNEFIFNEKKKTHFYNASMTFFMGTHAFRRFFSLKLKFNHTFEIFWWIYWLQPTDEI